MIEVLHVEPVGGYPVRFFQPPHERYKLPWHAIDDLLGALGLSIEARTCFLRWARSSRWARADTAMIATGTGLVPIATNRLAQSLMVAMINTGRMTESFAADYMRAAATALHKLEDGPFPARQRQPTNGGGGTAA